MEELTSEKRLIYTSTIRKKIVYASKRWRLVSIHLNYCLLASIVKFKVRDTGWFRNKYIYLAKVEYLTLRTLRKL